ncbi:MerR family transcriptional regulator, partial [Dactylosporangium sp. NPDC006015]|uniref:MerR family transcriptional regulator n=1 Tax=Dactylosporangium sp. NPDC006015 TaxID=3154576 RepID=UPI0033ADB598
YDHDSLVRLEFVRTLRELGLDIATIKRVLAQGRRRWQGRHAEVVTVWSRKGSRNLRPARGGVGRVTVVHSSHLAGCVVVACSVATMSVS